MQAVHVLVLCIFSFILFAPHADALNSSRVINDSLVKNLECGTLNINNIYRAIRDDAFDVSRHMPVKNWGFQSGLANIAGCWALSRTQRMMTYLARYNTSTDHRMEERVATILDMVRGATLIPGWMTNNGYEFADTEELNYNDEKEQSDSDNQNELQTNSLKRYCEKKLTSYKVFPVEDSSFSDNRASQVSGLWTALQRGYHQYFGNKLVPRNFREEIEAQQERLFYRIKNLKMIWRKGDRPDKKNRETAKLLMKNLDGKRLTLINLRMDRARQHVVMAKSYKKITPEIFEIKVYDSNAPQVDSIVFYNKSRTAFFAPDILKRFKDPKPYRNLGVFIVDEQDRGAFEVAMLSHYQNLCK